jgi:hypothetical protein
MQKPNVEKMPYFYSMAKSMAKSMANQMLKKTPYFFTFKTYKLKLKIRGI